VKDDLFLAAKPGTQAVMLGNHALARGAVEAGVHLVTAYPGTPSSEIVEALCQAAPGQGFHAQWSTNEKVAIDVAAGAALVGMRSLAAMKSAGLSVAMDTFVTVPYGGVKGGFVIIVADDPDAHFSSTEHDSRPLSKHAEILCLEPADGGEGKEMVREAFAISERLELPVMVRSVSRVSHGSANVGLGEIRRVKRQPHFNKHYGFSYRWDVYGPPGTRSRHEWLVGQFAKIQAYVDESPFNQLRLAPGSRLGVIASGLGAAYAADAIRALGLEGRVHWLKLGTAFPLPEKKVAALLRESDTVLVVEEGVNWIETLVREIAQRSGAGSRITGKGEGLPMPLYGEINTDLVKAALAPLVGKKVASDPARKALKDELSAGLCPRSSTLCAGCPHLGSYWGLRLALQKAGKESVHILNGDIGCYEQAGYGIFAENLSSSDEHRAWKSQSVYEMLDTIYVMGSALGMAQGQSLAGYDRGKIVAIAGDSSFFHGNLSAIANVAWNGGQVLFMVLDNRWTAMTGHQPSPTTGRAGDGRSTQSLDIVETAKALGIKNVLRADAFDVKSVKETIEKAWQLEGAAIAVISGECRLQWLRQRRKDVRPVTQVDAHRCNACGLCLQLGCPALGLGPDGEKTEIDQISCNSCGLCGQVCARQAITAKPAKGEGGRK
jgi:indolepyruvate ferredoxin oxidoreductase alpha subunit